MNDYYRMLFGIPIPGIQIVVDPPRPWGRTGRPRQCAGHAKTEVDHSARATELN
jgi:hypothetical protein